MPKRIKICSLCGTENVDGTVDHLPPKAIFSKPRPQNSITVPACFKCNNGGSKDDEIFKTFLALSLGRTPATDSLFQSAISTARKKFSRDLLANMQRVYLAIASGLVYGQGYRIPLSSERVASIEAVIRRITTGLYYHHFGAYIGKNTTFKVNYYDVFPEGVYEQGVTYSVNKVGTGHFSYLYAKAEEDTKCVSEWIFEFYERCWMSCYTFFDSSIS